MDILLNYLATQMFVLLPIIASIIFVIGGIVVTRKFYDRNHVKPLANELAYRPPAYSLSKQIDELGFDAGAIVTVMLFGFMFPFFLIGVWNLTNTTVNSWVYVVLFVVYEAYLFRVFLKILPKLLRLRLGRDCELIVGQTLMQLMKNGYDVFHDIQLGGYNIDHLVIGPNGIFVIETKGRRKPLVKSETGSKNKHYKLQIKDGVLHFPNWVEHKPLAQAERQAKSVSKWLSEATGQKISSIPVLVFPGWFIERTSRPPMAILNHKELCGTIPKISGMSISPQLQAQIVYQIKQYNVEQDRALERALCQ